MSGENDGDDKQHALVVANLMAIAGEQSTSSAKLTEEQVAHILDECHGDFSAALDEIWSQMELLKIQQEPPSKPEELDQQQTLQFHQFCSALGMEQNDPFVQMVSKLTREEKQTLLQRDSAFLQQLLLLLDSEQQEQERDGKQEEEHPLQKLQSLFPNLKMEVIERAYEQQHCDLNATADKLFLYESAIANSKTFASVVKNPDTAAAVGNAPKTVHAMVHQPPIHVESLGQFPVLKPSKKPTRKYRGTAFSTDPGQRKPIFSQQGQFNAWQSDAPALSNGVDINDSSLTTKLKLERLETLFPNVDCELIRTAFVMNHGSLDATEAILQEVFQAQTPPPPNASSEPPVPPPDPPHQQTSGPPPPLSPSSHTASETSDELDLDVEWGTQEDPSEWIEVRRGAHFARIERCRQKLTDQYLRAFRSFRRDNYVIAADRMRDLRGLRHDLRQAQRDAAHDFFLSHRNQARHRQPIDLHGLIVMQALQVVNELLVFCQEEHIRQCRVICGVGYHSDGGKARLLYAIKRSLERRQIGFREEPHSGLLVIFPLTWRNPPKAEQQETMV